MPSHPLLAAARRLGLGPTRWPVRRSGHAFVLAFALAAALAGAAAAPATLGPAALAIIGPTAPATLESAAVTTLESTAAASIVSGQVSGESEEFEMQRRRALGLFGAPPPTQGDARAVLLEDATLRDAADSRSEAVGQLPAGSVVSYVEEVEDAFGRRWSALRDPAALRARRDVFLAPFGAPELAAWPGEVAVIDLPAAPATPAPAPLALPDAFGSRWWLRTVTVGPEHRLELDGLEGVSARRPPAAAARRALDVLGGLAALEPPPAEPLPGQLHVPARLPLVFRYDGRAWRLLEPPLLLDVDLSLLGNSRLVVDSRPPEPAGGPRLPCWRLVGALDARGRPVGRLAEQTQPSAAAAGARPSGEAGPGELQLTVDPLRGGIDLSTVAWPVAGLSTLVPPRLAVESQRGGVELHDASPRQAVYLEQILGAAITRRLHGETLQLDVWARATAAAVRGGTAMVGLLIEAGGQRSSGGESLGPTTRRFGLSLEVPHDAERVRVVLLPQDPSIAIEQQGSVIIERAVLRLAGWPLDPPAGYVPLRRVSVTSWEGLRRFTRAALAPTERPSAEIATLWPRLADSAWSEEDRRLILAGRLRAGMTPEQVRLSWGEPASTEDTDGAFGIERRWSWEDRSATFVADALATWSPPPPPEPQPPRPCAGVELPEVPSS